MSAFKHFLKDRRGNFGMMTAILLVPFLGCAGLALDFTHALEVRGKLAAAADAAALGAIAERSAAFIAVQKMTEDGVVKVGEEEGRQFFFAQKDAVSALDVPVEVSIKVAKTGTEVTSTVTFSADVPTTLLQILGKKTFSVGGVATAAYSSKNINYTDFFMLLDNTPSMGIGATQTDIDRLIAATANAPDAAGRNCAFACHMAWTGSNGVVHDDGKSNYDIARANNITLRIDVVVKAMKALMADATRMRSSADQYRIAAYTFGKAAKEPGYGIERVSALSTDMTATGNAMSQIALMTTDHHNYNADALTSFDTVLTGIGKAISGNGGYGTSTSDRQKTIFFVTDGLGDSLKDGTCTGHLGWGDSKRCLEPIDLIYCEALKKRNINIAILYTTYLPLPGDAIWDRGIKPVFADKIGPRLQECASPDLFFEVKISDDLEASMSVLFAKSAAGQKALRLTQ